jgi:hypothetical protein
MLAMPLLPPRDFGVVLAARRALLPRDVEPYR